MVDNQKIVILETGASQFDHLKFRAELVKTIGLAFGAPFSAIIIEALLRGIEVNWFLPIKILIAVTSLLLSSFMLSTSYGIMEDREWRIERSRRTAK
jgi:hypothetical protein